ncbi:MAG: alpha/beta fold hydrolase, partial [Acidobacteriota bacterium]
MKRATWVEGGQTTLLDGESIWFRIDGAGPTILFAHGFPTSSHDFAPIMAQLKARYRCVSFDFLGFGASSKPRREYSYPLQHEVLARVVEAADIQRAFLVVHDYAVTLGQDFLAGTPQAPFALDGVIFMNGAIDPAQHRARLVQRFLASRAGALLGPRLLTRGNVLRALRAVLIRNEHLPDDDVWESITNNDGLAIQPHLLHYIAERRARREELLAALGKVTAPKAFLWGADDPVSGRHVLAAVRHL